MNELPIDPVLPSIRQALDRHQALVLQAPPGAGKTTVVPPALRDAAWLADRSIVVLEPRRLAARAAAFRIAELAGEPVGESVGYRMRGESRVSARTRIEVVTEGILTRRLQHDPTLDGVGLVIFDEFHERSLDADLGLALVARSRELVRGDLRILIMSATLDGTSVARLLGGAPIITSEGRSYPVETRHQSPRAGSRFEQTVTAAVMDALAREEGDILVFLPGAAEIHRVEMLLAERELGPAVITPLFGALAPEAQDRAIRPDPLGRRKIVLSTSIAETSLTIEGVRVVVDSGYARVPRFAPTVGMTRLDTVRVSKASADQRRGRAGRIAPGVCYRLWDEHETLHLLEQSPPEILHADLAPLALDLAAAGVSDPAELQWLDAPPAAAFAQAREILIELDALGAGGRITPRGLEMAALPIHPRLAHMLLGARAIGAARLACDVAALLSDRDILRGRDGPADADLSLRLEALRHPASLHGAADVDRDVARRVRAESDRLARQLGAGVATRDADEHDLLGPLLALAYPDRVAQRRPGTRARFVLRNGRGAELSGAQSLSASPYLVAATLDDRRPEARIHLAAPVTTDDVRATFADQITTGDVIEFDEPSAGVVARRQERLGAIVLRDVALERPDPERVRAVMLDAIRRRGVAALSWSVGAQRLRERIAFIGHHDPGWPDTSDGALQRTLDQWLGPRLDDVRRLADLDRVDLAEALASMLDWRRRRELDELAPTHAVMPTGSRIPIDYGNPDAPSVSVRIQEVFGLTESPTVLRGRVPLTMELLSPAHRPVQVTRDLAGFWRTSYFDVRKDLRGRYPKHEWPEDPLTATPTKRAKPRR
jgi:ATP-dependent helicase HrpB